MHGRIHQGVEPLLHLGQRILDRLFDAGQRLATTAQPRRHRRPMNCFMISGVNAFPRSARASEATRKKRASVSNISPSRSKTTARIIQCRWPPRSLALREQALPGPGSLAVERDRAKVGLEARARDEPRPRPRAAAVTQRVVSSSVFGIRTIRACARSIRQQVSRQAAITSRSVGRAERDSGAGQEVARQAVDPHRDRVDAARRAGRWSGRPGRSPAHCRGSRPRGRARPAA